MKQPRALSNSAVLILTMVAPAFAGFPGSPVIKCAPDAVLAGSVCMDKYEASVWRIPLTNPSGGSNDGLVKKVRKGKAAAADLSTGGATQLGVSGDDLAPCSHNGQNCANDIYAVSLPSVTPSAYLTWFQAQVACTNSGKRLPSNAEWQAAVIGTPDPGPDNGSTDCKTDTGAAVPTGSRSSCISALGAFDMVGNLFEWVADWVPRSTACPGWGSFSDDWQCLGGADTALSGGPGALMRGGSYANGSLAGPLAVDGTVPPSVSSGGIGFRCTR